jgi:hypothetical protein
MRFGTVGSCNATFFGLSVALVVASAAFCVVEAACASVCVCGGFVVSVCALSVARVSSAGEGAAAFGFVCSLRAVAYAGTVELVDFRQDGATVSTFDSPLLLDLQSVSAACLVLVFVASVSLRLSVAAVFFACLSLVINGKEVPAVALAPLLVAILSG